MWKWEQQEPFGAGACNPDPDGDNVQFEFNLRFPGQYFDKETNGHYNYFRDYDPSLGRYAQSDPIGLRGGSNTYLYVAANAVKYIDPTGELKLPPDPTGLPPEWKPDPTHRDPNGERYTHPGGDVLDWHKGRPGEPGWRGKDHWHHNNGNKHLPPGAEVQDPKAPEEPSSKSAACNADCQKKVVPVMTTIGTIFFVWRLLCGGPY